MLVNKSDIKRAIVQESIVVLINNGLIQEAADMHFRNKELIDEAWLGDLIRKVSSKARGTDWAQVERELDQDGEKEDAVEKAVANTVNTLSASDQYTKQQAQDLVRRWIASDPELTQNDYRIVADLVFNTAQDKDLAADVVDAEKKEGDPVGEPADDAGADEPEGGAPVKDDSVMDTVKDLASVLRDAAQRVLLMKGLYRLLINKNTVSILKAMPEEQAKAVRDLLVQMMEMDRDTLAAVRKRVGDELGIVDKTPGSVPAAWRKEKAERDAQRQVASSEREAGLELKESKNLKANAENLIILEFLDMYIEKKK